MRFIRISAEEGIYTQRHKLIYICTFHIYWLSLVKFGISHLHIMLLKTGGFHGNQQREYCTSVMGINKIYSCTVQIHGILRLKNATSQSTSFTVALEAQYNWWRRQHLYKVLYLYLPDWRSVFDCVLGSFSPPSYEHLVCYADQYQ